MYAINAIAVDHIQSSRSDAVRKLLRLDHLNKEEVNHVNEIIDNYSDLFQLPDEPLGHTDVILHKITRINDEPISNEQYRFPFMNKNEIDKQIKNLLENNIIQPSDSPYNSPSWIVPKKPNSKGNKRWSMVIDLRASNKEAIGDAYPFLNTMEILD